MDQPPLGASGLIRILTRGIPDRHDSISRRTGSGPGRFSNHVTRRIPHLLGADYLQVGQHMEFTGIFPPWILKSFLPCIPTRGHLLPYPVAHALTSHTCVPPRYSGHTRPATPPSIHTYLKYPVPDNRGKEGEAACRAPAAICVWRC